MASEMVNFRANPELLAALRDRAERSGATVSDVIRDALQEAVASPEGGESKPVAFNPIVQMRIAATGDIEAQRALAAKGAEAFQEGDGIKLIETLIFARLAAAQGDNADVGQLLGLLALAGELFSEDPAYSDFCASLAGEALAIVSNLADEGVEMAEQVLPSLCDNSPPEAALIAKAFRAAMAQ